MTTYVTSVPVGVFGTLRWFVICTSVPVAGLRLALDLAARDLANTAVRHVDVELARLLSRYGVPADVRAVEHLDLVKVPA